ncbi:MAG: hypothetical protein JO166_06260 [Deltaproteobacteria bacterium]|nr:hypothetical protein [Deltaproteobacteria bacterium]
MGAALCQAVRAQNFLFFCDLGNLLIGIALWSESRLLFSWQAVSLLVFQTLYLADLGTAFIVGRHITGGTEYMFDPHIPAIIRLLGLYHACVPPLLVWAVLRLGYDVRAWRYQTLTACMVLPLNYFWRPQYNVNWARGLGHQQHLLPGWLYLAGYLIVVPAFVYWPTHLTLKRLNSRSGRDDRGLKNC